MSGPDPQRPDDRLLDEFLAGRSEVSRAYRAASDDTAPPALDAAVLQMAREAARRPPLRNARWRLPLAAAAVLVLSFGSLQLIREEPAARRATLMEAESPTIATRMPATGTEAAADAMPAPALESKEEIMAAPVSGSEDEPRQPQASRKAMPPAAAAPGESPAAQASVANEESSDSQEPDDVSGAAVAGAPPAAASRLMQQAPRPELAPAPAPAMDAAGGAETRSATQERQRAQSAREERSPEDWLRQIEAMLAAGERQRAIEELQQLRRRHPDFELPPELVNLLPRSEPPPLRPPGRP